VSALKNGQIDGFVTAGSFPAPNVICKIHPGAARYYKEAGFTLSSEQM